MSQQKNAVWRFFASVKLALIVLIILAIISIIGTLIKQGQEPAYYVKEYGANLAHLFETLNFTNMYSSWWYVALLALFAVNLVVCSIERLPGVWRMVTMDNLDIAPRQLEKMGLVHQADSNLTTVAAAEQVQQFMIRTGWKKAQRRDREDSVLLFAQKGAWTRLSVYLVHLSILVVLLGVMVGTFFGFKAYVFLPEGRATDSIYLQANKSAVPLGFKLQCDGFKKTFYPNGMVKEYRSDLTVIDPELKTPYHKSIVVNDPLSYRGLTFFIGEAYPLEEFLVRIRNLETGEEQAFRVPPKQDVRWQGTDVTFRITELDSDQDGVVQQARILFTAGTAGTSEHWIKNKDTLTVRTADTGYAVSFRQYNSVLLLIAKDPGVPIVYFGGILMVISLAVCFLLSHRRIWVRITPKPERGSQILLSGVVNKNKSAFEQHFQELVARIEQEFPGKPTKSGKKQ